ncbi:MAG: hypothetical protein CXT73_04785 [Methanobacteriota archaeon]|nr:MAG: hypothetical protein CXT73_04785 [Euryarchaeota archaeon]
MSRTRALSETGVALFSQSYDENNTKKDIGCLRSIVHKLFTSDYDIRLENTSDNMRLASTKVLSMLYSLKKIPEIHNNAISNLVALILSNGEKTLSSQQVKCNIGFYLNLAKKAIKIEDHQTAILIKSAVSNFNIERLKIKPNKNMKKIIKELEDKYGNFKNMHAEHIQDMIENKHNCNYLPSTMILHMHLSKNRAYEKAFRSFGNSNKGDDFKAVTYKLREVQSVKYQQHKKTNNKLCPIYETDPLNLDIAYQIENNKDLNVSEFLYGLSVNVSKYKSKNKRQVTPNN